MESIFIHPDPQPFTVEPVTLVTEGKVSFKERERKRERLDLLDLAKICAS